MGGWRTYQMAVNPSRSTPKRSFISLGVKPCVCGGWVGELWIDRRERGGSNGLLESMGGWVLILSIYLSIHPPTLPSSRQG